MKAKRAALYARVSDKKQDEAMQLTALREMAEARGYTITEYVDHAVSSRKLFRPERERLLKDARRRRIDLVMVWKFDRFARSVRELLESLEEFGSLGVDFLSYTELIDTTTTYGKLVFTVLGAVAEFERDLIRERVQAGVDEARRKGIQLGRPFEEFDLAKARDMRAKGASLRKIAEEVGVGYGKLHRMLKEQDQEILDAIAV